MSRKKNEIGRGSTCRCFRESKDGVSIIVKELTLPAQLPRFAQAFALQQRLCKGALASYVVKPLEAKLDKPPYSASFADDGGTTLDRVEFKTLRDILQAVHDAAKALHALHQKGLLYVDVKANNFLLCPNGRIKLFDFDSVLDLSRLSIGTRLYGPGNAKLADPNIRIRLNGREEVATSIDHGNLPYITPRLDIYGLGAMLYALVLKRDPCPSALLRQELRALCSNRFRSEMNAAQQRQLCKIMEKATQPDPALRYDSAAKLAGSLKRLMQSMDATQTAAKEGTAEDRLMTAAWVLDQHPLFRYQPDDRETTVLLVGDSAIRKEFLHLILACAQLPGAQGSPYRPLKIHLMTDRPEALRKELKAWGDLLKYLSVDDRTEQAKKQGRVTPPKNPFAHLIITSRNKLEVKFPDFTYVLLLHEDPEENVALAQRLLDVLSKKATTSQAAPTPRALLVGDLRTDGADPRQIRVPRNLSRMTCRTFALNGITAGEEVAFRQKVERDAFVLHTYYAKEQNQRISRQQLWRSFADYDSKYSSIRSVLSIPYKLHACGLDTCRTPAKALCAWLEAYDRDPAGAHPELNTLLHLEHRSWQCFALTQGWCAPDLTLLEQHAFTKKQPGHKLRLLLSAGEMRYHACLADSDPESSPILLPLSQFSRADWLQKADLRALDPLDRRSVEMHRLCAERVDTLSQANVYQNGFAALKENIPDKMGAAYRRACDLEIVGNKLLQGQTQTDALWHQIHQELTLLLRENPAALHALDGLQFPMHLVLERNSRRDYKRSDLDLLRAIPEILDPHPVERIYKLYSSIDWCNVVSAVMTDAQELVLLYDPQTHSALEVQERQQIYQTFFQARILQESLSITCLPLDSKKVSAHGVLDITGAQPQALHRALQYKRLQKLPVVYYDRGSLHGLTQEGPIWSVYNGHQRSLSVGETLMLGGNTDLSDRLENELLALHDQYRALWKWVLSVPADDWNMATKHISQYASAEYPMDSLDKAPHTSLPKEKQAPSKPLTKERLERLGLAQVLDALVAQGVLTNYQLEDGNLTVYSTKPVSQEKNQAQIARLQSYIALAPDMDHRYELREVPNHKDAGAPVLAIYDRHLGFFSNPTDGHEEAKALSSLMAQLPKGLIRDYTSKPQNNFRFFDFTFATPAVRDCLLKSGNVLEAFAYHVISDSGLFDDVKPNVHIHWAEGHAGASRQTTNEVDLICTKGMRTYFISCKKTEKLSQSYYDQVWYQAHRLGVDAVPILLCTEPTSDGTDTHISRGKRMGVETILLPIPQLSKLKADDSMQPVLKHEELLRRRLQEILSK